MLGLFSFPLSDPNCVLPTHIAQTTLALERCHHSPDTPGFVTWSITLSLDHSSQIRPYQSQVCSDPQLKQTLSLALVTYEACFLYDFGGSE